MSGYEQKQFRCFACDKLGDPNQYYYYSNGEKFTDPEHTILHKHVTKNTGNVTGGGYKAKSKADYTQRNEDIRETQSIKHEHDRDMLDGQLTIAEEYKDGMKLIADSNTKLSESQNANTIELVKVVDRLTEILQKLNLGSSKK